MNSRKHDARVAGVLYLLLGVTSALGMNIPSAFMVDGDAAATVAKIESSHFRSEFIPRILGVFLIIGCFGWLGISVAFLLFPAYTRVANQFTVLAIGEILIILWLVIWGVRTAPVEGQPSESRNRVAHDA